MTIIPFSELAKELKNNDLLATLQHWEEEAPNGLSPEIRRLLLLLDSCHWQAEAKTVKHYENEEILDCEEKTRQQAIELLLDWQDKIYLEQVLNGEIKTAKLFSTSPIPKTKHFLGQGKSLRLLHFQVQASERPVAVQGLAGTGKTTFIAEYIRRYKGYYKNVAWIPMQGDWVTSFLNAFPTKELIPYRKNKTDIEAIHAYLNDQNTESPSLLVLDKFDDSKELMKWWTTQQFSNWSILISTCEQPDFAEIYPMTPLSLEEGKTLFLKHCPSIEQQGKVARQAPNQEPKDNLKDLLEYIDCHPLILELLAKAIETNPRLNLPHVANDLQHSGLTKLQLKGNLIEQEALLEQYITRIFSWSDMTQLKGVDKVLLKRIAALDSKPYTLKELDEEDCFIDNTKNKKFLNWIERLQEWIVSLAGGVSIDKETAKSDVLPKVRVEESLNRLVTYGWLNKEQIKNSSILNPPVIYSMHPSVQSVVQKSLG